MTSPSLTAGRAGGIITAAGLSRRMGAYKPLLPFRGRTVLESAVDSMLTAGVFRPVVVLGYRASETAAVLRRRYGDEVLLAWNRDYGTSDMLASVKIGCRQLPDCGAFFMLPGDMPLVRPETYAVLLARMDANAIIMPVLGGHYQHPPLIGSGFLPAVLNYTGENGLRGLWRVCRDSVVPVEVGDDGVGVDLDTPGDYTAYSEVSP